MMVLSRLSVAKKSLLGRKHMANPVRVAFQGVKLLILEQSDTATLSFSTLEMTGSDEQQVSDYQ